VKATQVTMPRVIIVINAVFIITVQAGVVAPFSSGEKSLKGVTRLLAEGRCALATNFAAFKYNHTSVV
jgi:hypothetical protein